MKDAPIPLALQLWSLGHSQADIAAKLGFPNRKPVERIVANARAIGDPRAVYHVVGDRILGKALPAKERYIRAGQAAYRGFPLVERVLKPTCPRGHARVPDNLDVGGHCLICERARAARRPPRRR